MPISEVFNMDCVSYMQTLPDNFFDLAIVDPPYGIGAGGNSFKSGTRKRKSTFHKQKDWDLSIPNKEYFDELFRVSKNQIIWGGNYMTDFLQPSRCWIFWDKGTGDNSYSDGELAWCSIDGVIKKYTKFWSGFNAKENNDVDRFHPTQKPIALYKWLIEKYAKAGDKIFDSHMGSQSSRIAAFNMGFDYWGCELDEEYFNDGNKRFIRETMQQSLFTPTATKAEITQTTIF